MLKTGIIFLLAFGLFNALAANNINQYLLPDTFNIENPDHFINHTKNFINNGQLNDAKIVIDLGIEKGTKEGNNYLLSNLEYYLADYYYYLQEYDSAQQIYLKVLPLFENQKDTLMMAKTLNSIGLIYAFEPNHEKSLHYYLLEYDLLNKVKYPIRPLNIEKMALLTNIINLYSDVKEHQKVIDNSVYAIRLAHELHDSVRLGSVLNSLALAQKNMGNIDQALATFHQASSIFNALNDDFRNAHIINNIGGIYELNDRNLDSALFYYDLAVEGFEKENFQWGISQSKLGLAAVLSKLNDFTASEKNYNDVIEISKEFRFYEVLSLAYEGLAQMEYDRGNYKKAFELHQFSDNLNDSIFNEEKHKQYAELLTKYELIQKENEINLLKNEKLMQELKLERANLQKQIVFIMVIFLLIIITVIVIYYNQKKRDNQLLVEQNNQIELQNKQLQTMNEHIQIINKNLQQSEKELTLANNSKNKFFSILAHDLRNPFHTILGQSYLLSKTYDKLEKKEQKNYADEMYSSCEQVNRLLENLLEWGRTQFMGIPFQPEPLVLDDLIVNTISLLKNNAEKKSITIVNEVEPNVEIMADKEMVETIFRNIINNGIKFTPTGGWIKITSEKADGKIRFLIEDNGLGIEKANQKKLFKIDSNFKTRGTNNESGTGLGLVICKEFIDLHKGKIWVESEFQKGSRFYFELPLN